MPPSPTPSFTFTYSFTPTFTPTITPSPTYTTNPFATATWTPTWDPYATDTATFTYTPVNASSFTPTSTFTFTQTGTIEPTNTPTVTVTNTPGISRADLSFLGTAYSNAWDRTDGFNWDMAFTYYIGSIISRDYSKPDIDSLEPTRFAILSSDVKYAWLADDGDRPAMASGLLLSFLAQLGSGNSSTGTSGTQSFQVAGNVMGAVYGVLSKTVAKDTAVHAGYIYGLKEADKAVGLGFITYNYSELLPLLTTKLQGIQGESPASIFYTGFSTRFWGRNWRFEIWKPFPMDQNPILLNTQIDGLPLAFNLGYERWDPWLNYPGGWALLGYVNIKFTIVPQPPAY